MSDERKRFVSAMLVLLRTSDSEIREKQRTREMIEEQLEMYGVDPSRRYDADYIESLKLSE